MKIQTLVLAIDLKAGQTLDYPYPWDEYIYSVDQMNDGQVRVRYGQDGSGTRFFEPAEQVPVR